MTRGWEHFLKTIPRLKTRPMTTAALLVSECQKVTVISKTGLCTVSGDGVTRFRPFDDGFHRFSVIL